MPDSPMLPTSIPFGFQPDQHRTETPHTPHQPTSPSAQPVALVDRASSHLDRHPALFLALLVGTVLVLGAPVLAVVFA